MERHWNRAEGMLTHSTRDAVRLLQAMLIFMVLQALTLLVVTSRMPGTTLRNFTGSLVMAAGCAFAFAVLRRSPLWAAHLLCGLQLFTAAAAALGHGVRVPAVVGCFVAVALAGYLMGLRSAIGYAVFSLAGMWTLYWQQTLGRITVIEPPVQAWGMVLIGLLIVTGFLLAIPLQGILRAHARLVEERRLLSDSIREHAARSKGLEAEVEQRTRDLQVINADLERFPLALAHDLRTPLQSLSGYATMLGEGEADAARRSALQELQDAVDGFEASLNRTLESGRKAHLG